MDQGHFRYIPIFIKKHWSSPSSKKQHTQTCHFVYYAAAHHQAPQKTQNRTHQKWGLIKCSTTIFVPLFTKLPNLHSLHLYLEHEKKRRESMKKHRMWDQILVTTNFNGFLNLTHYLFSFVICPSTLSSSVHYFGDFMNSFNMPKNIMKCLWVVKLSRKSKILTEEWTTKSIL